MLYIDQNCSSKSTSHPKIFGVLVGVPHGSGPRKVPKGGIGRREGQERGGAGRREGQGWGRDREWWASSPLVSGGCSLPLVGGGVGHSSPLVYGGGGSSLPFGSGGGGGFFSWFVDGGCGPLWMVVGVLIAVVW